MSERDTRQMVTMINGKPAVWTPEIIKKWNATAENRPEGIVRDANYFTPRPYVDEYNKGSRTEGFTYTVKRQVYQIIIKSHDHIQKASK